MSFSWEAVLGASSCNRCVYNVRQYIKYPHYLCFPHCTCPQNGFALLSSNHPPSILLSLSKGWDMSERRPIVSVMHYEYRCEVVWPRVRPPKTCWVKRMHENIWLVWLSPVQTRTLSPQGPVCNFGVGLRRPDSIAVGGHNLHRRLWWDLQLLGTAPLPALRLWVSDMVRSWGIHEVYVGAFLGMRFMITGAQHDT